MESFQGKHRFAYLLAASVCTLLFAVFSGCSSDPRLNLVENGLTPPVAEKVEDFIVDSDIGGNDTVFREFSYQKTPEELMDLGFDPDEDELLMNEGSGNAGETDSLDSESDSSLINSASADDQVLSENILDDEASFITSVSGYTAGAEIDPIVGFGSTSGVLINSADNQVQFQDLASLQQEPIDTYVSSNSQLVSKSAAGEGDSADVINIVSESSDEQEELQVAAKVGGNASEAVGTSVEKPAGEFISYLDVEESQVQAQDPLPQLEQSWKRGEVDVDNSESVINIPEHSEVADSELSNDNSVYRTDHKNAGIQAESPVMPQKDQTQLIPGLEETTMLTMADESEEKLIQRMRTKTVKLSEYDKRNDFSDNPLSPEKSIITLSLAEALRLSFSGNPDVVAASYVSRQAEEKVNANKSVYDTVLYSNTNSENKSDLDADYYYKDPDPGMITDGWSVEGGIKQHLPTGGDMTAGYEYAETKQKGIGKDVFRGLGGPFISIKQPLLRGLMDVDNRTAIKVSILNASIAQADFMAAAMDSVYDVCASYWNMVFYMESMAIQKSTLEMAKEVYKYEITRKDKGISRNLSVERARAAVDVRKTHLLQARDNVLTALDQMVIITGGEDEFAKADLVLPTDQPLTAFATPDTETDLKSALTLRPELKRGYSGIEIGKLRRDQAKYNTLPTLDLQAKYGLSSGDLGMNDHILKKRFDRNSYDSNYWNIGINFNYQVGSRASLARMREAEALIEEKKAELVKRTRQIKIEVRAAERSLITSRKNMKLTFNAKEAALRVMDGERIRLKLGMSTNEELLRAQDYYAQRETEYFKAIIDCNISALKLARARGTILNELGIKIAGEKRYSVAFPYSVKPE